VKRLLLLPLLPLLKLLLPLRLLLPLLLKHLLLPLPLLLPPPSNPAKRDKKADASRLFYFLHNLGR
jgi:hypothetical protein